MSDPHPTNHEPDVTHQPTGETRPCPACGKRVGEAADNYPFCSKRCRDVDLGHWFSGSYSISRDIKEADLET